MSVFISAWEYITVMVTLGPAKIILMTVSSLRGKLFDLDNRKTFYICDKPLMMRFKMILLLLRVGNLKKKKKNLSRSHVGPLIIMMGKTAEPDDAK